MTPDAALTLLDEVAVWLRVRLDGHEARAEEVLPFWRAEYRWSAVGGRHGDEGERELGGEVSPLAEVKYRGKMELGHRS